MREGTEQYRQAVFNLYLLSMGKYEIEGNMSVRERRKLACLEFNQVASISFLCHNLNSKLSLLPEMAALEEPDTLVQI